MIYFLDTNICINYLKGTYPKIRENLFRKKPEQVKIPVLTKAELLYGAEKSTKKADNLVRINRFLLPFEIISLDDSATDIYAKVRFELEKKGKIIGPNDLLIASIVLSRGGVLVTNNTKEFGRIEKLKVEDWTR